jgi:hypothetical protein
LEVEVVSGIIRISERGLPLLRTGREYVEVCPGLSAGVGRKW